MASVATLTTQTGSKASSTSKGKRSQKVFLEEKGAALALATSIAEVQEGKSKEKTEKYHQRWALNHKSSGGSARRDASLSSKDRLKHAKAAILAEKAKVKRAKSDKKKQIKRAHRIPQRESSNAEKRGEEGKKTNLKRVSFA